MRSRRPMITLLVALSLVLGIPAVVVAAHGFTDVPASNVFTSDIEWLAENNVTRGCNPPTNNRFCPEDNVTREQMAAFMHRLAATSGMASDQHTDFVNRVPLSNEEVEVARVTVTPESNASVMLSGHAFIERLDGMNVQYSLVIRAESCGGPSSEILGQGYARLSATTGWNGASIAVTAADSVGGDTDYVLCSARPIGGEAASVVVRGLNATWIPTA